MPLPLQSGANSPACEGAKPAARRVKPGAGPCFPSPTTIPPLICTKMGQVGDTPRGLLKSCYQPRLIISSWPRRRLRTLFCLPWEKPGGRMQSPVGHFRENPKHFILLKTGQVNAGEQRTWSSNAHLPWCGLTGHQKASGAAWSLLTTPKPGQGEVAKAQVLPGARQTRHASATN